MSHATVRIPSPLRPLAGGADEVNVQGATVGEALRTLDPALVERVLTPEGELRPFINVYLRASNIRTLQGLATPVGEGDVLVLVPAVAGGNGRKASDERIAQLRTQIPGVSPQEALALQREGAALIDVREPEEISAGTPLGALPLGNDACVKLGIPNVYGAVYRFE
jgi:sulfur-carrier protein adenylyltransferase/sulfurtransferase